MKNHPPKLSTLRRKTKLLIPQHKHNKMPLGPGATKMYIEEFDRLNHLKPFAYETKEGDK